MEIRIITSLAAASIKAFEDLSIESADAVGQLM
jgi:hypothetical protein